MTFEAMLAEALEALRYSELRRYDSSVDRLVQSFDEAGALILGTLGRWVRTCWSGGWQPGDLMHVIRNSDSTAHAKMISGLIVRDAQGHSGEGLHPLWESQVNELAHDWFGVDTALFRSIAKRCGLSDRSAIETGVALVLRLSRLPQLPILLPPPGTLGAGESRSAPSGQPLDPKIFSKVRALLSKAESTHFAEEADAFTAKAQQLMTRYSIDVAMLAASAQGQSGASARRIHIDPPYVDAKASLVGAVASANHCRAVLDSSLGFVTVFGFDTELALVDVLFTSLLAQGSAAMIAAGKVVSHTTKTKSFRHSFLVSFASRIGQRLREAAQSSTEEAQSTFGAALVPILAQRDADVDEAVSKAFPKVTTRRQRVSSAEGWEAGRIAADKANLASWSPLAAKTRPEGSKR